MEENSKMGLVHCPKCDHLLPELNDYPVYQCGACGTFLRVKKKGNLEVGKGLERCREENIGVVCEKYEKSLGKTDDLGGNERVYGVENGNLTLISKVIGNDPKDVSRRDLDNENVNFGESEFGNLSLRSKVNKLETHFDNANVLRKSSRFFEYNLSDIKEEERFGIGQGFYEQMKSSSSNYVVKGPQRIENDPRWDVSKRDFEIENVNFCERQLGKANMNSKANYLGKSGRDFERSLDVIREEERFGTRRGYFEEMGSSSSNYVGRDTSKYCPDFGYKREANRATRAEDIEPDRKELLRKLEELQDELSRVQSGNNKFHKRAPLETVVESKDYFRDHKSTFHEVSRQFAGGAPYIDQYHETFLHQNGYDRTTHTYQNSVHGSSYVPRYEDPFESQIFRRPPPQRIPNHRKYINPQLDHYESQPYDTTVCHLSCSCHSCYDRQHQAPSSSVANRRFPHIPNNPIPNNHQLYDYNSRVGNSSPLSSSESWSHKRWPSDLKLERDARARPQRAALPKEHHYRPVANGAPFVTCRNCFELLKLPKKVINKIGEWQMSCAACSSVISFAVLDEKLVSVNPSESQTNTETKDIVNEMAHKCLKNENGSYCSEDYANSIFDFQAMDRDSASSSASHSVSSSKSVEMRHNINSLSFTTFDDDHFSYDMGNSSSRSVQEKVMTNKNSSRKYSLKDSLASEIEFSPDDYDITRLPKDASGKWQEDDRLKGKKGDSFFAGILKKSFRSNHTTETAKKNVMVNGHLIPDRLVKKAEKLAGPVYSGEYWYDYRAGFWGVMGGPCLGIVPPLIEEFNYPMPEKCGAGNTDVFVNGRELHQKDLELLSTRGLPSSKDRSYIVDFTGKIVDEDTNEELVSLGKLAPTVEKVKHGFGMRAPKSVA